jgi:hypothetical protein
LGVGVALVALMVLALALVSGASGAQRASRCGRSGKFSESGGNGICTYTKQGTEDTFTVPSNVKSMKVKAVGADGGHAYKSSSGDGALGAEVINKDLILDKIDDDKLYVIVGEDGKSGTGGDCFGSNGEPGASSTEAHTTCALARAVATRTWRTRTRTTRS